MKIAITGARGMLGQALCRALSEHTLYRPSSRDLDITSQKAVREFVSRTRPDWILHTAAFTHVDGAESRPVEAFRVNAVGTRNLACAAFEAGSRMLYYSTDYVFDGKLSRPYLEWDQTSPLSTYGRSKLAGEWFVRSHCPSHLIVRTSWLFGPGGSHFVRKILERARQKQPLRVVDDQRGTPTFTLDLAYMTLCLLQADRRGTYHVTNGGACSWHEFAQEIVRLKGLEVEITTISSQALAAPAERPSFSVLDNYLLKLEGVPLLRPWQSALEAFLKGCNA